MIYTCLMEKTKCEFDGNVFDAIVTVWIPKPNCPRCGHPMAEVVDLRNIDYAVSGSEFARVRGRSASTITNWYHAGLRFVKWYGNTHIIDIREAKGFEIDDGRGKSSK